MTFTCSNNDDLTFDLRLTTHDRSKTKYRHANHYYPYSVSYKIRKQKVSCIYCKKSAASTVNVLMTRSTSESNFEASFFAEFNITSQISSILINFKNKNALKIVGDEGFFHWNRIIGEGEVYWNNKVKFVSCLEDEIDSKEML
jgi:hypothetical protein